MFPGCRKIHGHTTVRTDDLLLCARDLPGCPAVLAYIDDEQGGHGTPRPGSHRLQARPREAIHGKEVKLLDNEHEHLNMLSDFGALPSALVNS